MKWLSVKKFKPINSTNCLIVYGNNSVEYAYVVDGLFFRLHSDQILKNVTHFCIPDPVEIEKDEK